MNGNKPIEQIIENAAASVEMEGYTIDSNGVKNYCVTKSQCRNIFHSLRKKQELRLNGIQ